MAPQHYFTSARSYAIAAGEPAKIAGGQMRLSRYACVQCGHGFSPLDVEPHVLAAWYRAADRDGEFLDGEMGRRMTARAVLRRISRQQRPGSLLDAGAGPGFFVSEAQRAGWRAVGMDPAGWAVRYGREVLGVPMIHGMLPETRTLWEEPFDVITLFDVIEHDADPLALLRAAAARLRTGGLLVLTTPRFDSLLARCLGRRWYCIFPAHIHYFTRTSLRLLLSAAGFALVEQRRHSRFVSARAYWQRLCAWLGGEHRHVGPAVLRSIPIPVKLGDEFEVYARKL